MSARTRRRARRSRTLSAAVAALLLAACGSDDGAQPVASGASTGAPTTEAADGPASTMAPDTTTATTSDTPATTAVPVTVDAFDPDCVDRAPTRPLPDLDTSGLDTFGPMGDEPVIQVLLPGIDAGDGTEWVRTTVQPVPGGVLLVLRPYDGVTPATMLTVVDADGGVRWIRCLDRPSPVVSASRDGGSDAMLALGWATYLPSGGVSTEIELRSLADGTVTHTWDDLLTAAGARTIGDDVRVLHTPGSESFVVAPSASRPVADDDRLIVIDPRTAAVETLRFPPTLVGTPLIDVTLAVLADGRLAQLAEANGLNEGRVVAVQDGDGWTTDPADLDTARPVYVNFAYSSGGGLRGFDATGDELWRRDDLLPVPAEGFAMALDGDVVLAQVCSAPPSEDGTGFCPGPRMVAVDATAGATLWERTGWWTASVVASGRALVSGSFDTDSTAPTPWQVVDLRSGEQVGDRTWGDPWGFGIDCCDGPATVSSSGGVVVSIDADTVEVWYPEARSTPLVVVDLSDA